MEKRGNNYWIKRITYFLAYLQFTVFGLQEYRKLGKKFHILKNVSHHGKSFISWKKSST